MKSPISACVLGLTLAACDSSEPMLDPDSESLWMLQTRVFTDEDTFGYAIAVTDLAGHIQHLASIEQGGGGMVYASPGDPSGSFLLSFAEAPTLTRHEVTDDNQFVTGQTMSFAAYGVDSGYGVIAWVDEHTAYWFDNGQLQAIRFDPAAITIDRALPIDGVERDGYVAEFSGYPVVRDDGVYVTMRWRREWENPDPQAPAGAMLVHIDPTTDEVTVTEDERCTSLLISQATASGDTYWFSDNYNTYARIIGGDERGVPDCSLRLRAGETTFDPTWSLDLADRTGGRPADGVVAGAGSTVWLSVFHAEALAAQPEDIDTADVAPAWRWYALDLESDAPAEPDLATPLASHGAFGWFTAGRAFSSSVNSDYSESTLLEVTEDGFVELATVDGLLDAIVQVR